MLRTLSKIVAAGTMTAGIILGGVAVAANAAPVSIMHGTFATLRMTPQPGSYALNVEGTSIYANVYPGGYVDTYNGFTANDAFLLLSEAGGAVALGYDNSGQAYYTGIVGDCGNNQYSARACVNTPGGPYPWGANLIETYCSGGTAFADNHWGGAFLGPALPTQNGGAWYLNTGYSGADCFNFTTF